MARFLGTYNSIPSAYTENSYILEEDFGFLRNDGILVISPEGTCVNGSSIPRLLWFALGHPLESSNKYWSCSHDSLYGDTVIIIDTNRYENGLGDIFLNWRTLKPQGFIHRNDLDRKWADINMKLTMEYLGEGKLKVAMVYRAVRLFGAKAYQ